MAGSIAAVVVTRNRKVLLGECMVALVTQTHKVDGIYVIDQASSDGTGEMLKEAGLLSDPKIKYHFSSVNTGGAGGFHLGMQTAYRDGFEWIWIMDDDSIPHPDACEKMLPYMGREEVVAIANQKLGPDGFPDRRHIRMLPRRSGDMVTEYSALDFSSFVGLLVSHKAIHTIGLPKAELFYQEDDSEYCLRLRSVGVIAFAEKSCVTHKYASAAGIAKTFRGRTYNRMSADRYCLRYFYWRNRLWLRRISSSITSRTFLECLREFCHEVALVVLVDRDHTLLRLSILVRAFRNGMTARFDNVFPFTVQTRLLKRIQRIGVNYPLYRWIQLTFRR